MPQTPREPLSAEVVAGQAVYSPRTLSIYDWLVLRISNRFIWRCPTPRLLAMYDEHVSANHLDVGVGTGYFLDHCRFPSPHPRLVLLDLNQNCLERTCQRIARYSPSIIQANVLEPIEYEGAGFDSIGLNYLLHCLPGPIEEKCRVFDHLLPLLNPGGVLFGSTLLSAGVKRSWSASRLMGFYQRRGIFSNAEDSAEGLKRGLNERFDDVNVTFAGCGALFVATR